ncbi:MAG: hypothetical protein CMF59_16770 [Leptospiraceae bacterium]|nr:hypothetical protein [Leptospiraceae bacterium]
MRTHSAFLSDDMRHKTERKRKESKKARKVIAFTVFLVIGLTVGTHYLAHALGGSALREYRRNTVILDYGCWR